MAFLFGLSLLFGFVQDVVSCVHCTTIPSVNVVVLVTYTPSKVCLFVLCESVVPPDEIVIVHFMVQTSC